MGFGRAAALVIMAMVVLRTYWRDEPYAIQQSINLVFHEAGHLFFAIFEDPWPALGGSLFEVGLPGVLALIAMRDLHWSAMGACLVWMSTALYSVSVYAGDAQTRALPLVGGEAVIHDWWYVLNFYDMLERDQQISARLWWAGAVVAGLGLLCLCLGVIRGNRPLEVR